MAVRQTDRRQSCSDAAAGQAAGHLAVHRQTTAAHQTTAAAMQIVVVAAVMQIVVVVAVMQIVVVAAALAAAVAAFASMCSTALWRLVRFRLAD